ncbi:MAG TPA: hypothetical protein ACQGQG_07400, partial [Xylella sp.]
LLLRLRAVGLCQPLPFGLYSAWEYYTLRETSRRASHAARERWRGNEHQWGEGRDAAVQLAFRGRDPFATPEDAARFAQLAEAVFDALTTGQADPDMLTELDLQA